MTGRCGALLSVLLCAALLTPGPARAAPPPARIVSINLCTDLLLLDLAPRRRIVSVSYLAADPRVSPLAGKTAGLMLNRGLAEEVMPLQPDLVLAGAHGRGETIALLRRFGIRVAQVRLADTIDQVPDVIRAVARLIGEETRGDALARDFETRLAALSAAHPEGRRPLAALYYGNGTTSGAGTMPASVVRAAGFDTLGERRGIVGDGVLPLERLLLARPALIVTGLRDAAAPAEAVSLLAHPAIRQALPNVPRIAVAERDWICGTPHILDTAERIAATYPRLAAQRRDR